MGRKLRLIIAGVSILMYLAQPAQASENLDRIRAAESISYFVWARFPEINLRPNIPTELFTSYRREGQDASNFSSAIDGVLNGENENGRRLWVHRAFGKLAEKWKGMGGIASVCSVVVYDDVSELRGEFNPDNDLVIMRPRDLEGFVFSPDAGMRDAVILTPADIKHEYMDHIVVSLLLIERLKVLIKEGDPASILKTDEFRSLKVLLGALFSMSSGIGDSNILNMIPRSDVSFAIRALSILENSLAPIRRENIDRLRSMRASFKSV